MRYRLCKSWLLLTLFPYLCFALIGLVPHTHGHEHGQAPLTMLTETASSGTAQALSSVDGDDADHCSLCQVQANIAACGPLALPCLIFAPPQSTGIVGCIPRIPPALAIHPSSRAPPASW